MDKPDRIVPQDIVQIDPLAHQQFGGKFMGVSAVSTAGFMFGYFLCGCGQLNASFQHHQVALVGRARWKLGGEVQCLTTESFSAISLSSVTLTGHRQI